MHITSNKTNTVIDYYPIKDYSNNIDPNNYLRVLTYDGQTQTKRIVNSYNMGNEILNRTTNYNYSITDNSKGLPQYHSKYND